MAELTNLPRQDMFSEIAAGLPLILESAVELASAADALQADHARSKEILTLHAEEEAAKAFMLLDLVRCPERLSSDRQRLGKQLTHHLSRLIYAETCKPPSSKLISSTPRWRLRQAREARHSGEKTDAYQGRARRDQRRHGGDQTSRRVRGNGDHRDNRASRGSDALLRKSQKLVFRDSLSGPGRKVFTNFREDARSAKPLSSGAATGLRGKLNGTMPANIADAWRSYSWTMP